MLETQNQDTTIDGTVFVWSEETMNATDIVGYVDYAESFCLDCRNIEGADRDAFAIFASDEWDCPGLWCDACSVPLDVTVVHYEGLCEHVDQYV